MCCLSETQRKNLTEYLNEVCAKPTDDILFNFEFNSKHHIQVYDEKYSFDEEVITIYVNNKNEVRLSGVNKNYKELYSKIETEIKKYLKGKPSVCLYCKKLKSLPIKIEKTNDLCQKALC